MKFDLVKFSRAPTIEFNRCKKKIYLLELGDFYNITLTSRNAKKCVIKNEAGTFTEQN